ncbi:MAG: GspMb/PilO family protein [Rubrivivax sp.]
MSVDPWHILFNLAISLRRARPVLGLGVIAAALGAAGLLLWGRPQVQEEARLRQVLVRAHADLQTPTSATPLAADPDAQRLADFESRLGDQSDVDANLARIFALARQYGLELAQTEYRWQVDEAARTERFVLQMPVKGSYQALRAFLEQVLAQFPFASLDDLGMRREAISDGALSANVRISLHLKPGVASAEAARRLAAPPAGAENPAARRGRP